MIDLVQKLEGQLDKEIEPQLILKFTGDHNPRRLATKQLQ
jgi:hypothetical protein